MTTKCSKCQYAKLRSTDDPCRTCVLGSKFAPRDTAEPPVVTISKTSSVGESSANPVATIVFRKGQRP